ncbi:MAG: hypothetical protein JWL91_1197 [Sphingomonas bacterium]|nr:DUF2793 domain-containing protein [Sphingomonas bacterium]MDB5689321.1 hypothetical protein [Sphingomonas bacterium]
MTEMTSRFALPLLQPGQAQKELHHNEALTLLDLAVHATVKSAGINAPPANALIGDCWVVGTDPEGAWSGHAREIAGWTGGGWRFVSPPDGMVAWCVADALWVQYNGGTWVRGQIAANSLWINGMQVVGARRPAIAQSGGGATVDAEARSTISAIIAALQAHGLIGA